LVQSAASARARHGRQGPVEGCDHTTLGLDDHGNAIGAATKSEVQRART